MKNMGCGAALLENAGEAIEAVLHGAVEDVVAHPDAQAAEQRGGYKILDD